MKRVIVAFICGALLAGSTATAATQYWTRSGNSYICEGIRTGVKCRVRNTGFFVSIYNNRAFAVWQRNEVIFGCEAWATDPYEDCDDFR